MEKRTESERMKRGEGSGPSETINGVNVARLKETIELISNDPGMARCSFRATNRWVDGGHNRAEIGDFYGARQENQHLKNFRMELDEHPLLLGEDEGANPVEYVLAALSGCLTSSLIYHAAAQGIEIEEVESEYEGDLDLRGFLGMDEGVRNGYQNIRVNFRVKAEAPQEKIDELVRLAQARSPVFDIVTHPVNVSVTGEKMERGTVH